MICQEWVSPYHLRTIDIIVPFSDFRWLSFNILRDTGTVRVQVARMGVSALPEQAETTREV